VVDMDDVEFYVDAVDWPLSKGNGKGRESRYKNPFLMHYCLMHSL